ncbi:DUF1934 domain-containing protein [Paenibacillus sp. 453mf]|uniref:DUF1934 domain-containing protein n=1 Tax=Paenibacillus sp. 453mf TaxID=1761874 RepID=UPI0008EFDF7E|nr:DUF1934 domain-containing protein [Paenibacillus sp. 453mf]SFS98178.1 Uncharacterized beta-barrel protein YwiB, DUF1934 family [Paenibacillus sp. 453mf]
MSGWNPVKVHIYSMADGEKVIQTFTGEAIRKGSALYVRYEEEEQVPGGSKTRNTIKVTEHSLKLIRHGGVESEQNFELGQRLPGFYKSPYTSFALSTDTKKLEISTAGMSAKLAFRYDLYMFEEKSGHFDISMEIQEEL